jgi:hypothetical protein
LMFTHPTANIPSAINPKNNSSSKQKLIINRLQNPCFLN